MSRPLRIVRVMPFFDPAQEFGGSVAQARATTIALAARGHRVSVVTSDLGVGDDVPRGRWLERDGYRVFHAHATGAQRRPPYPAPPIDRPLREALADAEVLCLNVGLTLLNDVARRAARRASVGYVYNAEGALCPGRLAIKRVAKWAFVRLVERRVLRDADALQAVTEKEIEDLARQGAERSRIHHIPNGVAIPSHEADGAAMRAGWGIPDDAIIVLFLGRLHAIKGLPLLLAAAAPVLRDDPRAHLVLAGPDEGCGEQLRRDAERLGIADRVVFAGLVPAPARDAALAAADVFALTSYTEGLPNAALEAAAAGLPLLLTESCNLPEVARFDAGWTGPAERTAIELGLRELLESPARRSDRGDNARRMVEQMFALDRVVDRLEQLYREVAKR